MGDEPKQTAEIAVPGMGGKSPLAALSGRPKIFLEALQEEKQQREILMKYVESHMIEGTDFGLIPNTKTKTLLKPGAEKLTDLFRCIPEYEIVEKVEDWDRPLFHYLFRCRIISRDTGAVVAEGFGSCNSRESKYRWRTADRVCPDCGAAAIMRSKYAPRDSPGEEPGWFCYGKRGGCGQNFYFDDNAITSQATGRAENPDVADNANTILKMAKKRAQVDAVIALARCSEMFTQDIEDDGTPAEAAPKQPQRQAKQQQPQRQQPQPAGANDQQRPYIASDADVNTTISEMKLCNSMSALQTIWAEVNREVREKKTTYTVQQMTRMDQAKEDQKKRIQEIAESC